MKKNWQISFIIWQTETSVLQLLLCILDTIELKFATKFVAMIYTVCFEIIIQRAVGNELCYLIKKKTLIITVLYNTSRKSTLFHDNT
jgi:hypothetical protein